MTEAIKIFLGTEPKTKIADQVLEYSIRRRTTAPVEIVRMIGKAWEYPLTGITVGTGFSLRRWMIPARQEWTGRAIYLDADQLVFGDIADLWNAAKPEAAITCSWQPDKFSKEAWPQTSVMVIDCQAARDHWGFRLEGILQHLRAHSDKKTYADFMHATWLTCLPDKVGRIGEEWNHLDKYAEKKTKLIHYTSEASWPWVKPSNPLAYLWENELRAAIKAGAINRDDYERAIGKWGKKEDFRPTNGIHPHYRQHLSLF